MLHSQFPFPFFGNWQNFACLFSKHRLKKSEVGAPPKKNMMQLVMKIFASVFTGGGLGVMVVYAGETGLWLESQETEPWCHAKWGISLGMAT